MESIKRGVVLSAGMMLLLVLLQGCALLSPDTSSNDEGCPLRSTFVASETTPVLVNATQKPVLFLVFTPNRLALVRLSQTLTVDDNQDRLLEACTETSVTSVAGYEPGYDLSFVLYLIDEENPGKAEYAAQFTVTHDTLLQNEFRITIDDAIFSIS